MKLFEIAQSLNLDIDLTIEIAAALLRAANVDLAIDGETDVSDDLLNAVEQVSTFMAEHQSSPLEAVQLLYKQEAMAATDALICSDAMAVSVAQLAAELEVSPDRVIAILETLYNVEADENTELTSLEVIQQVKATVLYMAEHGIADATAAAEAIREELEADLLPQTFGALSEHDADLAVVKEDVLNRIVGFEIASNIEFATAIANGYDEEQLNEEQKNALNQSRDLVKAVVAKRFGRTRNFLQLLANGKRQVPLNLVATVVPKSLASSKQL